MRAEDKQKLVELKLRLDALCQELHGNSPSNFLVKEMKTALPEISKEIHNICNEKTKA